MIALLGPHPDRIIAILSAMRLTPLRAISIIVTCLMVTAMVPERASAQLKDTLFLHDGQVLSGELKKYQFGKIEFDMDNVQIVNVKYTKIRTIRTHQHIYRVETSDRRIITGIIKPTEADGIIRIQSGDSTIFIPITQVTLISVFDQRFIKNLHGYVSAGYSYTRSSNIGRFNLDGQVNYNSKKTNTSISGNAAYTQANKELSRDRENLTVNSFYLLNPWWSLGLQLGYQRNLELGLQRRFQQALGVRYNIVYKSRFQMRALTGIAFNEEKNTDGLTQPIRLEIPFNVNMNFFKFQNPNISFNTSQTVYISLSQQGRIRYDGDTYVSWEMVKDFYLTLNFYHNYDSKPVIAGASNVDYGVVLGLKYTF